MFDEATRQLAARWHALEAERAGLHHLPTGAADPALRESQIDEAIGLIEFQGDAGAARERGSPRTRPRLVAAPGIDRSSVDGSPRLSRYS